MLADPNRTEDADTWQQAASFVGATVHVPTTVAINDEWELYREIRERQPRILVTTVPMAVALTALDFADRSLAETTLVVTPVHVRPAVLLSLGQFYGAVHGVLYGDAVAGPILFDNGRLGDGSVCFEPLAQVSVRVLDRYGRTCPIGIDGDVEVFTDPDASDTQWAPAGFRGRWVGEKHIRVSSWQDDAMLRGRVAAVEKVLSELSGIEDYHVELRRADTGEARLLIWVQQAFGEERTSTQLRKALGNTVAGLRCPIIVLDVGAIPRRPDGRVVASALDDPFADVYAPGFELPSAGTEAALAEIWSEILGIERIGAHDTFAELGGSSLQALRVIQRMETRLGWRVEPRLLFFQSLRRVAGRAPEHADRLGQAA
jgi:acyl carrier protein